MTDSIDELKRRAGIIKLTEVGGTRAKAASTQVVNAIRQGQAEEAIQAMEQIQDGGTAALTAIFAFTTLQQTDQGGAFIRALQTISEGKTRIDEIRFAGGGVPGTPGYMRKYGGPENSAFDASQALRNEDPATAEKILNRTLPKQAMFSGLRAAEQLSPEDLSALMAWLRA